MRFRNRVASKPLGTAWQSNVSAANGDTIRVDFKSHSKAKRFILRLDPKTGYGRVTVPLNAPSDLAENFAAKHVDWLILQRQKRWAERGENLSLSFGQSVPWDGRDVQLLKTEKPQAFILNESLYIPAHRDLRQATLAFFSSAARMDLTLRITCYEKRLFDLRSDATKITKIRITDTTSRWGSCSSRGVISLSKRLMMAPSWIRNYICAHEVAHLAQQDHSPKFWALCQQLEPNVSPDKARQFLRKHGPKYFGFAAL